VGGGRLCDVLGAAATSALAAFEWGLGGGLGYRNTAQWIDALGFSRTPLLITEMSAHLHVSHGSPNPACGGVGDALSHYVCGRIRDHFNAHGVVDPSLSSFERSVRLFGLPVTDPVTFEGRTVQWFERARLELHPENGAPFDVLGGLIGGEASGTTGWGC
jgi:hypothetical protein